MSKAYLLEFMTANLSVLPNAMLSSQDANSLWATSCASILRMYTRSFDQVLLLRSNTRVSLPLQEGLLSPRMVKTFIHRKSTAA